MLHAFPTVHAVHCHFGVAVHQPFYTRPAHFNPLLVEAWTGMDGFGLLCRTCAGGAAGVTGNNRNEMGPNQLGRSHKVRGASAEDDGQCVFQGARLAAVVDV